MCKLPSPRQSPELRRLGSHRYAIGSARLARPTRAGCTKRTGRGRAKRDAWPWTRARAPERKRGCRCVSVYRRAEVCRGVQKCRCVWLWVCGACLWVYISYVGTCVTCACALCTRVRYVRVCAYLVLCVHLHVYQRVSMCVCLLPRIHLITPGVCAPACRR